MKREEIMHRSTARRTSGKFHSNVCVSAVVLLVASTFLSTQAGAEQTVREPIRAYGIGRIYAAAYSPDGLHIATCGQAGAFLLDVETGNAIRSFLGHTDDVVAIAFSPDGSRLLTGSEDKRAKLWNVDTGVLVRTFSGHTGIVYCVAFSLDGSRVLTGSGYPD